MLPNALNFVHGSVSNNLQNNGTKNDKSTTNSGENEIEVRRGTLSTLEASKAATIDITDTKTKNMNLLTENKVFQVSIKSHRNEGLFTIPLGINRRRIQKP